MSPFEAAWVARRLRDPASSRFGPAQSDPEVVEGAGPRPLEGTALSASWATRPGAGADRPAAVAFAVSERLCIRSHRATQFIDVTGLVADLVARHHLAAGQVTVQTLHTTTGIVVNEHEPLLLADFRRTLARVAPRGARYAHDDFTRRRDIGPGERVNARAHCQALFVPTSATLVVADGGLVLGRWQRVFFVELDGPQARAMCVSVVGVLAE
jgi:secondary thiamine-phosphate synthase enzyme